MTLLRDRMLNEFERRIYAPGTARAQGGVWLIALYNLYGPTEATVDVKAWACLEQREAMYAYR
jgi:hypothetical protein